MAQQNPWEMNWSGQQPTGAPSGPVYGAPPKPDKPNEPKTTWTQGVVNGKPVQISSEGKVEALPGDAGSPNSLDPKTLDGQRNISLGILKNAGVDFAAGKDPVADLILGSTSGRLQKWAANAYGAITGDSTSGMENIARLATIGNDMVLQMSGGSLGAQISNSDREFIAARMGDIANPDKTDEERFAAWDQVKQRLAQLGGVEYRPMVEGGEGGLTGRVSDETPGLSLTVTDDSPPEDPNAIQVTRGGPGGGFWSSIGAGVGDIVEGGLNNTVGLVTNPVSSVIGRAMGYEGYTGDIGQTIRDALQLPEGNQTASAINQAAAGGFSGAGLARNVGRLAGSNALLQYGSTPVLDTITGATAAGSGEIARQMGAGPGGQALATLAGGSIPSLAAAGRNALAGGGPPRGPAPDMNVVRAGERQGVPIRQPDARPELRGDFANLQTSQYAGPAINQARAADAAAMEAKVAEVGGQGSAADPYALGNTVQGAGKRYIASTRAQANRLYDNVRKLSGGQTVTARNAAAALDANIQELRAAGENSNGAAIKYLEGLRNDIDRGLTVDAVQNLRTNMRGQLSERGLTGTDTDRRLGQVIDAMNMDLAEQLPPEASAALKAADGFYRQRQEFINGTLKQFMGDRGNPLPAETAAQRLVSMAQGKGNFERFSKMWGQLEEGERADVAATIAASLGRKQNGDFSVSALIKSLDPAKGINPRTARLVFGEDGAKALADLRVIAQAKSETAGALNNSKTGVMVGRSASGLRTLILGGLGFSASGPVGAVAAPMAEGIIAKLGQERAARLMLNSDFTKWLRAMPEATNPKAINAYFSKFKASAAKSQIVANDFDAFTNAVAESVAKSPGRAAAQEEDQRRVKPPKQ
jgi:hypothetical protein